MPHVDVLVIAGGIERCLVGAEYGVAERDCAERNPKRGPCDERADAAAGEFCNAALSAEPGAKENHHEAEE